MTRRVDQLNWDQLSAAAESWQLGGSLALGAWAAKNMPRFTTADYGALVQEVRDFLGDDTDYSQQTVVAAVGGMNL